MKQHKHRKMSEERRALYVERRLKDKERGRKEKKARKGMRGWPMIIVAIVVGAFTLPEPERPKVEPIGHVREIVAVARPDTSGPRLPEHIPYPLYRFDFENKK